jgi:hypothetical protein
MPAPETNAEAPVPTPPAAAASPRRALLWAYRLFPLGLLPVMLVASRDFGITWDEKTHQMYGEAVWQFVTERADSHWFHDWYMYLHGGLFDALCVAAQRLLPGDPWTTRHYVNALFGWLGIAYVGRLGRLLAGPATGLLAMALLALSPRYLADSMNNPKDAPFAALTTVALYYLFRLRPSFPFLGLRQFLPLALAIALALNVRAGALLLLAYVAVALAGLTLAARALAPRRLAVTAGTWLALAVVVLLAGTLAWPWAQVQPLKRPFDAIQRLSSFDWDRTVLFDGADVRATALPLDYVPRWAAVTTPPVVLLGAAASLLLLRRRSGNGRWRVLGLWATALFPAAYVALTHATIYDGIRHLLFAYPPLVALAACGWHGLLDSGAQGRRLAVSCVLAAGLLEPAWFCWRNHPNECVYFNLLAGGPRGALGRYELDYWGNSVHQAVAWVETAARQGGVRIVVSGHPPQVVRDEARRLSGLEFARAELRRHQLDVLVLRGPRREVLELAARTDVLHRVTTADDATLAVVVPGPAFAEIAGLPPFTPKAAPALH